MTENLPDPLADFEKRPSWSWKGRKVGSGFKKAVIVEPPKLVQGRTFPTKEPAKWPDGQPKMVVVVGLEINGEEYSLWANKPSALYRALVEAQKNAGGERMKKGGFLSVKFTKEVETEGDPQRLFEARYEPPTSDDPFADDEPPF